MTNRRNSDAKKGFPKGTGLVTYDAKEKWWIASWPDPDVVRTLHHQKINTNQELFPSEIEARQFLGDKLGVDPSKVMVKRRAWGTGSIYYFQPREHSRRGEGWYIRYRNASTQKMVDRRVDSPEEGDILLDKAFKEGLISQVRGTPKKGDTEMINQKGEEQIKKDKVLWNTRDMVRANPKPIPNSSSSPVIELAILSPSSILPALLQSRRLLSERLIKLNSDVLKLKREALELEMNLHLIDIDIAEETNKQLMEGVEIELNIQERE